MQLSLNLEEENQLKAFHSLSNPKVVAHIGEDATTIKREVERYYGITLKEFKEERIVKVEEPSKVIEFPTGKRR